MTHVPLGFKIWKRSCELQAWKLLVGNAEPLPNLSVASGESQFVAERYGIIGDSADMPEPRAKAGHGRVPERRASPIGSDVGAGVGESVSVAHANWVLTGADPTKHFPNPSWHPVPHQGTPESPPSSWQ